MEYRDYNQFVKACESWRPHVIHLCALNDSKSLNAYLLSRDLPSIDVNPCLNNLSNQMVNVVFYIDEGSSAPDTASVSLPLNVDPKRNGQRAAGFGHLTYQQFLHLVVEVCLVQRQAAITVDQAASQLLSAIRALPSLHRKAWEEIERKVTNALK